MNNGKCAHPAATVPHSRKPSPALRDRATTLNNYCERLTEKETPAPWEIYVQKNTQILLGIASLRFACLWTLPRFEGFEMSNAMII